MSKNTNAAVLRSHVTKAVAEFSRSEQSARTALLACAAATWEVSSAGLIGKDMSGKGGWESQKDYAALFVSSRTGQPVSHTTVTMWRRVGRAMSLGITPDSKDAATFDRIVQCFGDARVSEVLETGSKTAIVKAVKSIYTPDGKRVPAPAKGKGAKATADEKATEEVPVTRNNSTVITTMETLAARLTATLSKAEAKRLEALVENLQTRLAVSANGGKPVTPVAEENAA